MSLLSAYPEAHSYLDIIVFVEYGDGYWAQERFLVHGYEDVMWTSDIEQAINFLKENMEQVNKELNGENKSGKL